MTDAIVIGAGPNGLVAANLLADAGWDVTVFEAASEPGGAVKSGELTEPGYVHDLFSAFYPLAAASPIIQSLDLPLYGLEWERAPLALAHPTRDGKCAVLSMDENETAASLDEYAPGDGDAWRDLYAVWMDLYEPIMGALFTPFPPVLPALGLGRVLVSRKRLSRFMRLAMIPVRRLGEEQFRGPGGGLLLAGNALHTDLAPENAGSGVFGWLLTSLGQQWGFPVPRGGAGRLTDALVARFTSRAGHLETDARVERVLVKHGRAEGVRLADGREIYARRAVIADTDAPSLFRNLVGEEHLPSRFVAALDGFQYDNGTVKVDWALKGKIPWTAEAPRRAGTVHLAPEMDELTEMASQLTQGLVPAKPFLVMGQMTTADPTRSPEGSECLWAYAHVPQEVRGDAGGDITGKWDDDEGNRFADRMEARIEEMAPGFKDQITSRHVFTPPKMEAANANLVGGAINGGTAQLHQQLMFRPVPGMGRPETPIRGLYLASASAHPGGGVHGAPGANAARIALRHFRAKRAVVAAGALGAARVLTKRR